jgi:hypothetical protein
VRLMCDGTQETTESEYQLAEWQSLHRAALRSAPPHLSSERTNFCSTAQRSPSPFKSFPVGAAIPLSNAMWNVKN